ncbi:MAG: hypothetical protein WCZ65_11945 [Lysobacteraceae bacterium]
MIRPLHCVVVLLALACAPLAVLAQQNTPCGINCPDDTVRGTYPTFVPTVFARGPTGWTRPATAKAGPFRN